MSFQPPSKSLTVRDYQFIALAAVVLLVLSAGLVSANLTLQGGGDFFVHWVAGRGVIFDRIDPYGEGVPARVQELVYQGPAPAGSEPYILDTPFHLLLLYFPFSLLSDSEMARALFTLILEFALFSFSYLSLRLTDWRVPRYHGLLFLLFGVFNFYSFQAVLEASPVLMLGLFYAGMLSAFRARQDEVAGALMALSFYYWEVGGLFILLFIWRAYREKRGRFFSGAGMLTFVLAAGSFLIDPNWMIPFLRAGLNNLRTEYGYSITRVLLQWLPIQNENWIWMVAVIFLVVLGYEWNVALRSDDRGFYWAACLSLAVSPLLGIRTEMEHLAVLILPFALIFSMIYDRWKRLGEFFSILFLLLNFIIPWVGFFFPSILPGQAVEEILFVFLPVSALLGLYWVRWWTIRPPRLWSDLIRRSS